MSTNKTLSFHKEVTTEETRTVSKHPKDQTRNQKGLNRH